MPRLPASELINQIEDNAVVIADGAMGTELMRRGAAASETLNCNRTHPDWVKAIHHEYIEAGARLLYSNTFAPPKSRDEYADVLAGWQLLNEVCRETGERVWAALSLYPATVITHPELMDQIFALSNTPDLVVIETCCSLDEAKQAIKAIRQRTARYIFATATFSKDGKMLDGTSPGTWYLSCEKNRDLIGFGENCSPIIRVPSAMPPKHKPMILRPSVGLPDVDRNYWMLPSEVRRSIMRVILLNMLDCGGIAGGCCGTTPEYIGELTEVLKDRQAVE